MQRPVRLSELTEHYRSLEQQGDVLNYVRLLAKHSGDAHSAHAEAAARRYDAVARMLKTAVAAGVTTASAWADDLAGYRAFTAAYMTILSAQTLLGRINFRRADFNTRALTETAPGAAAWVAEGLAIPASKMQLDNATLDISKIGGLIVLTLESVKNATPASLESLNRSMTNVIGRYSDVALLDPSLSAVTGKNPASLTNAGTQIPVTGSNEAAVTADLKNLLQFHINAGADMSTVVIVAHPTTGLFWSQVLTAGNVRAFPNVGARGGEIWGIPVLTTVGATATGSPSERIVAAINPEGVLVADDGDIFFDASRHAAIQADDAPTNSSATPTATSMVSLMQTNSVAIRATRHVNWKSISGACSYMRVGY